MDRCFFCVTDNKIVVNGVKSDWGVGTQCTLLGPLLFSLHISDITSDKEAKIRLFVDDCACYHGTKVKEDTLKLQRDIDRLGNLTRK